MSCLLSLLTVTCTLLDVPELVIADTRAEVNVTKGLTDYQIECSYRGLPAPEIVWYKNDEMIQDTTEYTIKLQTETIDSNDYDYVKVTSQLQFKGGCFRFP